MKLRTRHVVISGALGSIAIFLGQTGIGFIPTPLGVHATIMHLPVIIGAVLEGPIVGTLVGFIFGFFSFIQPRGPYFADPLVSILPRLFIGIVSYLVYKLVAKMNGHVGLIAAGLVGSLTNTVLVLGMLVVRKYMPFEGALSIAVVNGLTEAVVAAIIVYFVCIGVKKAREEKI